MKWGRAFGVASLSAAVGAALLGIAPPPELGPAMVAADHVLASEAGAEVLRRGGNAADAAAAAALAAGVVQPPGSGLGGGGFAVGRAPGGEPFVLDFREVAPASATEGMFRGPDGRVIDGLSTDGGKAAAVPGEARGL
ncbi:MAG: gamma-glutamyltransferase, partial [Myxococcota bacterium]